MQPFAGFADAAEAVLAELRDRLGLHALLIVRQDGENPAGDQPAAVPYRVEHAAVRGDGYQPGSALPWPEVAAALLDGSAPPVAPVASAVSAYAVAVTPGRPRLGAVIGAPIVRQDGSTYGVLLGLDPAPHPPELAAALPLVEVMARLLGTMLGAAEPRVAAVGVLPAQPQATLPGVELSFREPGRAAAGDGGPHGAAPHGLATRRQWEQAVRAEEARCRRYGNPAAIVAIDLEPTLLHGEPADDLLRRAADTVLGTTRAHDLVAWLGRTELGVLAVECDEPALAALIRRLQEALAAAGVRAAVTGAVRASGGTLEQAWEDVAASGTRQGLQPT